MSPERPEQDDFLEDEEQEEYGQRSIFATGWFRAVLVLLVLAGIAVIAVPLIGDWFEPTRVPAPLIRPVAERELLDIDSLSANPRAYRATHVAADVRTRMG